MGLNGSAARSALQGEPGAPNGVPGVAGVAAGVTGAVAALSRSQRVPAVPPTPAPRATVHGVGITDGITDGAAAGAAGSLRADNDPDAPMTPAPEPPCAGEPSRLATARGDASADADRGVLGAGSEGGGGSSCSAWPPAAPPACEEVERVCSISMASCSEWQQSWSALCASSARRAIHVLRGLHWVALRCDMVSRQWQQRSSAMCASSARAAAASSGVCRTAQVNV